MFFPPTAARHWRVPGNRGRVLVPPQLRGIRVHRHRLVQHPFPSPLHPPPLLYPVPLPSILTHPVHSHRLRLPPALSLYRIPPSFSLSLYQSFFTSSEFFPCDISSLLSHPSTLGTFLAVGPTSSSFALMSLYSTKDVFRLRVTGASNAVKKALQWARVVDERAAWLKVPSLRDMFRPFGVYVMYGLYMEGKGGKMLMKGLCRYAHNLAMEDGEIAAVVAKGTP